MCVFFCQAEDGIRDLVRSRGLGDVYKRQEMDFIKFFFHRLLFTATFLFLFAVVGRELAWPDTCLLYTSDAADERSSVDLGGRRILKKKTHSNDGRRCVVTNKLIRKS